MLREKMQYAEEAGGSMLAVYSGRVYLVIIYVFVFRDLFGRYLPVLGNRG